MVSITIGKHTCKLIPIKPKPIQFDKDGKKEIYVNVKGERLNKIQLQKAEYKWVNKVTGKEHDNKSEAPSKSFNGQPVGYQDRTDLVEETTCEILDIMDYAATSKTYQVISSALKEELEQLEQEGKAVTFQYNSGRNYIPERAIVYFDKVKGVVLMRTVSGSMKEIDFSTTTEDSIVEVKEKAKPLAITV